MIELARMDGSLVWVAVQAIASIEPKNVTSVVFTVDGREIDVYMGEEDLRELLNRVGVPPLYRPERQPL